MSLYIWCVMRAWLARAIGREMVVFEEDPPTDSFPDAVPKKRGPKTDVLEALLKRVDGLEKKLKDEKKPSSPTTGSEENSSGADKPNTARDREERERELREQEVREVRQANAKLQIDTANQASGNGGGVLGQESAVYSPTPIRLVEEATKGVVRPSELISLLSESSPPVQQQQQQHRESLLDTYFTRCHGKPYFILDEPSTRQRIQRGHLPSHLLCAMNAVSARWASRTLDFLGFNGN